MGIDAAGLHQRLAHFCRERGLPAAFERGAAEHLGPLAQWIARERRAHGRCMVVGINGAQGTGKSTLAAALGLLLGDTGLGAAVLSLDDLYLTRQQRSVLARSVHPLLATRGVPGTHEVETGIRLLERLRALGSSEILRLPRFDKLADDRCAEDRWPGVEGPIDVVLFEGWCVATPPQADAELDAPVNALEAQEDADGRWRRWVNDRLRADYAPLFALVDRLVFLRAPGVDQVLAWRAQQEAGLLRSTDAGADAASGMNEAELRRFVQHYERLTRHALAVLPDQADACIDLARDHSITRVGYRESRSADAAQPGQAAVPPAAS